MASSQVEVEGSEIRLKQLGFVRFITINAVVLVSNIYDQAKQSSGSLRPTVDKVENAVTAVLGPVYQRLKDLPTHLLIFLDDKVDEASHKFDECAPPALKNLTLKASLLVKKASQTVEELAEKAKVGGPLAAMSHAGTISKHFAVTQMAVLWYKVSQHPSLHGASDAAVSMVGCWSEKFNKWVNELRENGYNVFKYVPLVPVEEMGKAYKEVEAAANKKTDASSLSQSESESDSDKE